VITKRRAIRTLLAVLLGGAVCYALLLSAVWLFWKPDISPFFDVVIGKLEQVQSEVDDADFVAHVPAAGPIALRALSGDSPSQSFEGVIDLARELGSLSPEHRILVFVDSQSEDPRSPEAVRESLAAATTAKVTVFIEQPSTESPP